MYVKVFSRWVEREGGREQREGGREGAEDCVQMQEDVTANEDAALEQYVQYVQVPHLLPGGLYGSQPSMEKPSRHVLSTKWRSSQAAGPPATRGTCTGHSAVCSVQP